MKNYLPIGSVVCIKNNKINEIVNVMIVGYKPKDKENNVFDYIGFGHPAGFINDKTFIMFNKEDIEGLQFIGFMNADVQLMLNTFKKEDK